MLSLTLTHLLTIVGVALGLVVMAQVITSHDRPAVSIAWVLAILLVPYVGVPAYILFSGRKIGRFAGRKRRLYPGKALENETCRFVDSSFEDIFISAGLSPARTNNSIEFVTGGEAAYNLVVSRLKKAETSIHITTFILGKDDVGRSLVDILARKAREGVEVRVLLDALWCFPVLGSFVKPIRDAGGQVADFMPFWPKRRTWSANLRNHRKMILIDNREAIIGGMNLADEYMAPEPVVGQFVDTSVVVEGPAVGDLAKIFYSDWEFTTGETLDAPDAPAAEPHSKDECGAVTQVVPSGPDVYGEPLYDALMAATYGAGDRVWILTPYFIPDGELLRALMLQARRGRDVRLIVPAKSNHRIADMARGRFLRRLHEAGATIHFYHGGMLHAKHLVFDHNVTITGSPNFDMRSLYFNYEVAMFMYSPNEVERVANWMNGFIRESETYEPTELTLARRWYEGLGFILAPLL